MDTHQSSLMKPNPFKRLALHNPPVFSYPQPRSISPFHSLQPTTSFITSKTHLESSSKLTSTPKYNPFVVEKKQGVEQQKEEKEILDNWWIGDSDMVKSMLKKKQFPGKEERKKEMERQMKTKTGVFKVWPKSDRRVGDYNDGVKRIYQNSKRYDKIFFDDKERDMEENYGELDSLRYYNDNEKQISWTKKYQLNSDGEFEDDSVYERMLMKTQFCPAVRTTKSRFYPDNDPQEEQEEKDKIVLPTKNGFIPKTRQREPVQIQISKAQALNLPPNFLRRSNFFCLDKAAADSLERSKKDITENSYKTPPKSSTQKVSPARYLSPFKTPVKKLVGKQGDGRDKNEKEKEKQKEIQKEIQKEKENGEEAKDNERIRTNEEELRECFGHFEIYRLNMALIIPEHLERERENKRRHY